MPTNKDNNFDDVEGGFEFEPVPTWDNIEEKKSNLPEKSEFDTDFANLDFGGSSDADTDAESEGGFDFNFDAMPTEQSLTTEQHRGDPSSEFEEFGISPDEYNAFESRETGFGTSSQTATKASSHEEAAQFDEFDKAFSDEEESANLVSGTPYYEDATHVLTNGQYLGVSDDDPYSQVQEQQPTPGDLAEAPAAGENKSLLSKLILPVGIGAIVIVGGFLGWSSLMSSTAPAPAVVANVPAVTQPKFPTTLPSQETSPVANVPPVKTEVSANPPFKQSDAPKELTFDLPNTASTDIATAVETPVEPPKGPVNNPASALPAAQNAGTELPSLKPGGVASQANVPSTDGVRSTVTNDVPAAPNVALKSDLKEVLDRLASLETKVNDLADSVSAKVEAPATPAAPTPLDTSVVPTGSGLNSNALPVASIDTIDPPLKPIVIKGLTLVGVSGETAWINTGKDVISVKTSDTLPRGGKVEGIRRYRGDWVLIATDGIILR